MVISRRYQHTSDAVASYSYTDIASGTGFIRYYLFDSYESTTHNYNLSTQSFFSQTDHTSSGQITANQGATKMLDLDFDLTAFSKVQNLHGTALANIPVYLYSSANADPEAYVIIKVVHYDGSTETVIGTGQSKSTLLNAGGSAASDSVVNTIEIELTETQFAIGDILRVTLELWVSVTNWTSGQHAECGVCHDPQNRSSTVETISTATVDMDSLVSNIDIPYIIDV